MPMQDENRVPVIYSVWYKPFDGGAQGPDLLAKVRSEYLTSGRNSSGRYRGVENGAEIITRYKIGRNVFDWLKSSGKTVLQRSFREKDGYSVLTWSLSGELTEKTRFDTGHCWIHTGYYSSDTARPAAMLRPGRAGGLVLLCLDAKIRKYAKTALLPIEYHAGSAEQSLVDALAGEPEIYAATDVGCFCYCTEPQAQRRIAVMDRVKSGALSLQPEWPKEKDAELHFEYIENDRTQTEPEPVPAIPRPLAQASEEPDYRADHELYSVDEPAAQPKKYAVAAKGLGGRTQVSSAIAPGAEYATKRIVVSAQESYLYFGKVIDGLRQGRGRTEMQNGFTAYDGNYLDDKREGFGVYYYKSGKICYAGNWKANLRDGSGVAFSSRDGSVFVGHWKDNTPTGSGAAFDEQGNLIYTGEWKNGVRHGHGTEFKNGEIVFSGEFRNDQYFSGYKRIDSGDSAHTPE